jgi:hypothetical protein
LGSLPLDEPLVVGHEEQSIPAVEELLNDDGAVDLEAIIVPLERRDAGFGSGELVWERVEVVVADQLEERTVLDVSAGFGKHVDLRRFMAELGRIHAGRHFEFL